MSPLVETCFSVLEYPFGALTRNGDPLPRTFPKRGNAKGHWCTWCGWPTVGRKEWHPECVRWYLCAKGLTVYTSGAPLLHTMDEADRRSELAYRRHDAARDYAHAVADQQMQKLGLGHLYGGKSPDAITIPPAPDPILCAECGDGYSDVDHTVALSVAHEHRRAGARRWWRAWTPGNLRPLCHVCHAQKTGADRRELSRLRSPQDRLF